MPFSGDMPARTFVGREGDDLSGEKGAGDENAGILHDFIELYNLIVTEAAAGKLLLLNDDAKFDVVALPVATSEALGVVKAGSGVTNTDGVLSVPTASDSILGLVKVGTGLSITDGVLSVEGSDPSGCVVLTGTVAHGGTIPLPDGYTQAQCKWMIAPHPSTSSVKCYENGTVSVNASRVLTAYYDYDDSRYYGSVSYIIVGVK